MGRKGRVLILSLTVLCASGIVAAGLTTAGENGSEEDTELSAGGNNEFACDLYTRLMEGESGNLFFSPFSIRTALAMTYAGARGETAEQMARVLHFGVDQEALHSALGAYIRELNKAPGPNTYKLAVANALWGQKGFEFLEGFLTLNRKYYEAGLETVDFLGDPEGSRRTINAWVEKHTNDKIKDLIPTGVINELTRLILTNAIYFLGTWDEQFKQAMTKPAPFYMTENIMAEVPFMHQQENFLYAEDDSVQVLEMRYRGHKLAMNIILPKEREGLAAVENALTREQIDAWFESLNIREVKVYIPKFKITSQFSLSQVLKAMGMIDAFKTGLADFTGITLGRSIDERLNISEVIHKTYVDVNEEGTEAAAATAVVMTVGAAPGPQEEPPVFRADHPFLFLIRDVQSGAVLFMGRLADPS